MSTERERRRLPRVEPRSSREFFTPDPSASHPSTKTVNIVRLKNFAAEKLPRHSALRDLLLHEKDSIPLTDFLARVPVWVTLLRRKEEEG